ncbi:MAG TPA: hypothetical protein VK897_20545 [Anaerolineales bacterium]|nr:hypothetical protein [Anaerolineales bacterium]
MFRNVALIFVITLALPFITAYGATVIPTGPLTILPEDCQLEVNEELQLELVGFLPRSAVVTWDVDQGGITSVLPGREAVLVAPSTPTTITITVSISPSIPGLLPTLTKQCVVTSASD